MVRDVIKEFEYVVSGLCVTKTSGCTSYCRGLDVPNCKATKGKPIKY